MRNMFMYAMIVFYVAAGINHFVNPILYLGIMPPYLPYHLALVYISGICEILFALLLLPKATRSMAAWLIIIMLIAIFPANVQMAVDFWHQHNHYLWIALLRLPLQIPLIYWAWTYTK